MPAAERITLLVGRRRTYLIAAAAGAAVFVLLAVLMEAGVLDRPDARILRLFTERHRQPFSAVAEILDWLDSWWLLSLIVAALLAGLWWSGRMVQSLYLGLTVAVALTLNPLLKIVFDRLPPNGEAAVVEVSVLAFPSGHTTTATATATALAVVFWPTRRRRPAVAVAAALALTMAVSRVYLGVHWPSDVAAGLALGFTVAMLVRALVPWPTPEDAAAARGTAVDETDRPGRAAAVGANGQGIDVVFLDWGNTLMVDNGMREGPMKDWDVVESEPGAQEALLRLRARYRLVVATNSEDSPASFVRLALARVGLDEFIDDVVSSVDVGDHKPNYAFFRAALLREGERGLPLDPRRAVMVGDGTGNDIAGARRAGMRTIWYNPTKRAYPDGAQGPDAVIRKLSDLPDAVDRLAGVKTGRRSRRRRKDAAETAAVAAAAAAERDLRAETASEDSAASAAAAVPGRAPEGPKGAPAAPPDGS